MREVDANQRHRARKFVLYRVENIGREKERKKERGAEACWEISPERQPLPRDVHRTPGTDRTHEVVVVLPLFHTGYIIRRISGKVSRIRFSALLRFTFRS